MCYQSTAVPALQTALAAAKFDVEARREGFRAVLQGSRVSEQNGGELKAFYIHNPEEVAEAEVAVLELEQRLRAVQRETTRDALVAYAALWTAQATSRAAGAAYEAARMANADANAQLEAGLISALDADVLDLTCTEARMAYEEAQTSLATARTAATTFGMHGDAAAQPLMFTLPAFSPDRTPEIIGLLGKGVLAQGVYRKNRQLNRPQMLLGFDFIGETEISANYSTLGPAIDMKIGYPSLYDPNQIFLNAGWNINLRFLFPYDPIALAKKRAARALMDAVEQDTIRARQTAVIKEADARQRVTAAAARIALVQERYTLVERRYQSRSAQYSIGAISPLDWQRECANLKQAEVDMATAWQRYVLAMAQYLDIVNGTWEVCP